MQELKTRLELVKQIKKAKQEQERLEKERLEQARLFRKKPCQKRHV